MFSFGSCLVRSSISSPLVFPPSNVTLFVFTPPFFLFSFPFFFLLLLSSLSEESESFELPPESEELSPSKDSSSESLSESLSARAARATFMTSSIAGITVRSRFPFAMSSHNFSSVLNALGKLLQNPRSRSNILIFFLSIRYSATGQKWE